MASDREKTGNTVIIGIDFGTTYSGVAFTWSKKIDRIDIVRSWESDEHNNSDEDKTSTAVSFGVRNKVRWGYDVLPDAEQAKWFKLLLIDDADLPDDVRNSAKLGEARAYLKKHNKNPVEVTAVFLRHLWNHAIQYITDAVSRYLINFSKFHIVITLPAIWPAYARNRMKEAANRAGMLGRRGIAGETELSFVSEPEAAALATLSDMEDRCDIKAGDSFVVVDCGGGTVDLISYEVVGIAPMVVKECVKGQGGLCGAVFVDEAFVGFLKQKFGEKWAKMKDETRRRLLRTEWEHGIKPGFDGRDKTRTLIMPFECLDAKSLRRAAAPKITLTASDVRGVFDPTVEKIRAMVDEQVAAVRAKKGSDPKYVIMVGGFGRSKYLQTSLKGQVGEGIEVLQSQGPGPWTAICRGAVLHAATLTGHPAFVVEVQARVARISCGSVIFQPWNPRHHDPADKGWHEEKQIWVAWKQMKWLLRVGDDIPADKPLRATLSRLYETDSEEKIKCTDKIYTSTTFPPPKRWDDSVNELCTITWDTEIDLNSLPTFTNPLGKVYHRLEFEVEMVCAGGSLDFPLYHDGKRQGSKNVVVNYEARS